eukprot:6156726-Amphidinium_carterae.1
MKTNTVQSKNAHHLRNDGAVACAAIRLARLVIGECELGRSAAALEDSHVVLQSLIKYQLTAFDYVAILAQRLGLDSMNVFARNGYKYFRIMGLRLCPVGSLAYTKL